MRANIIEDYGKGGTDCAGEPLLAYYKEFPNSFCKDYSQLLFVHGFSL